MCKMKLLLDYKIDMYKFCHQEDPRAADQTGFTNFRVHAPQSRVATDKKNHTA
jgi:hypothetical protein